MIKQNYKNFIYHGVNIACAIAIVLTPAIIFNSSIGEAKEANNVSIDLHLPKAEIEDINDADVKIESNEIELLTSSYEEERVFIDDEMEMYTTTNVNLRAEEGTDSDIIDVIGFSQKVKVLGYFESSDWYKVEYNNKEGFVYSEYLSDEVPALLLSSTAYWNEYNRSSASGRPLIAKHSLAGKVSWLGKTVELYKCNSDGSIGEYLGKYRFDDTGYGAESGVGSSKILKGRSIGTIENGTCIDIYMDTYSECMDYGRHNIYIRFID